MVGKKTRLTHQPAGFSIAPLQGSGGDAQWQPLMMAMPASDGFAPNVNVMIQPYDKGIDAYVELSLTQFKQAGMTVLTQKKTSPTAVIIEYTGKLNGMELHFYAKAVKKGKQVYLVTATALITQWSRHASQLKNSVDSFALE